MSSLIPFSFETHSVRVVMIDGNPWFVGKDVAEVLGYKDTVNALKLHCNGVAKYHPIVDSMGRTQEVRIINEPDTFRLIVSSTLPEAERFEAWLFEEVLPSIRKTGSYALPGASSPNTVLAAQLAELLQGKVLVDYKTLAELTRTVWAMGLLFKEVEPLTLKLQQQCGKPLIKDLLEMMPPAPAVPDYQVILETILNEIDQGKYPFPFAFREIDGMPCLVVRTMHLMAHLRHTPRLRPLFDRLELKSDRVLKRTLRQAGLIVRLRFDPVINDARLPHAVAIHIAGFHRRAIEALH